MGSQTPTQTDRLRVCVVSGTRRADLVLPAAVPVAELVPQLTGLLGPSGADDAHLGRVLSTVLGEPLAGDRGLLAQGVEEGAVLVLAVAPPVDPPRVRDDPVQTVADAVDLTPTAWTGRSWRRVGVRAAALSLGLGAAGLLLHGGRPAGAHAAALTCGLAVPAIALGWQGTRREEAALITWLTIGYAAVAGWLLAPGGQASGLVVAGAGAALAGVAVVVWFDRGQAAVLPPVLVGVVVAGAGAVARFTGLAADLALALALVPGVLAPGAVPRLMVAARISGDTAHDVPGSVAAARDRLTDDVRLAHRLVVTAAAAAGLLLVVTGPVLVALGPAGVALGAACGLVLTLRARRHRNGLDTAVAVASGLGALTVIAATCLVVQPPWRPATAAALLALGVVVLLVALLPASLALHVDRLADLLERAALVALAPLMVVATGLLGGHPG